MREISLALGSGGVKGNAHIGVIRVLEKHGFQINAVAGTSAGGIAAVAYAAGYNSDALEEKMASLDQGKLFDLFSRHGPGLLGVSGVVRMITQMFGEKTFQDLNIPCAVTAVDIISGQEVIIREGKVADALMATIAIPGIFPPKPWGDYLLVDGGVLDPVPVALAKELAPGLPVVASVLSPLPKEWEMIDGISFFTPPPVVNPLRRFSMAQAFEIFLKSIDVGMCTITELRLEKEKPDVIIRPQLLNISLLERVNVTEVVKLGETAAYEQLTELRKMFNWRKKLGRAIRSGPSVSTDKK